MTTVEWAGTMRERVSTVFLGSESVIDTILASILCQGHVLIEDVPGTGKTLLAAAVAAALGGSFRQIQCTPDLLPADVLGVSVLDRSTGEFVFREGPVVANVVLADEINRATPRTQSAFLEAMAEGQVTVEGKSRKLPRPYFMIATESPLFTEGTFPLPEVQKDRFFASVSLGYPDRDTELEIMSTSSAIMDRLHELSPAAEPALVPEFAAAVSRVHVSNSVRAYILDLIDRTRNESRLRVGVSPRGSLALYKGAQAIATIRNRSFVTPDDVQEIARPVLRNRLLVHADHEARAVTAESILADIMDAVPSPPTDAT